MPRDGATSSSSAAQPSTLRAMWSPLILTSALPTACVTGLAPRLATRDLENASASSHTLELIAVSARADSSETLPQANASPQESARSRVEVKTAMATASANREETQPSASATKDSQMMA